MNRKTKPRVRSIAVWIVLASCASCGVLKSHSPDPAFAIRGPMPTRAISPVHLTFLAFRPRSATIQPEGSLGYSITSAYSSMFENGFSANSKVVLDGELWRNGFGLRYGVSPATDVEVEVPLVLATSGFLDTFVESFHELFLFPNSGRDERPRFAYEMKVQHGSHDVYQLEGDELGLGDIPIVVTQRLVEESSEHPALAVRVGVELPTGSESRGFGNGTVDFGGGVLAQRTWNRWTVTGAVDYVVTGDSTAFEHGGVEALDLYDAQCGVEYRWNDGVSLLTGMSFSSSVTHDIDIEELDSAILLVDLGAAWDLAGGSRLTVGFEEDAIAAAGPDFTFFVAWSCGM